MAVQSRLLYAFRGWLAFLAFMDLGTAGRSYIERRSFLEDQSHDDFTVSRMLGMYSLLKALALIHCTLYIHYPPVVSLGYCALALTIFMYASEALYFHSTTLNFYVIFPCILNALTLGGLVYLPGAVNLWGQSQATSQGIGSDVGDENSALLRQLVKQRRTRNR